MNQLLLGLNEQQLAAVTAPDGPVIVLAGPGSGKTRVLTHRIAWLIEEKGIRPWQILAVTFTNKAAKEMRERIEGILGEDLRGLQVGTFHATCARILRREVTENLPNFTRDFVIFDVDDQKSAVEQAMKDLNIDTKKFNPNNMRNGISQAKSALIRPDEYEANNYVGELIGRIYRRYQEVLIANNAMDFDDLLMNTVTMFEQSPHVALNYQQRFQHILVDEFQDTNLTQYGIISQLIGDNNIFIVGDADQSIYKWRGADVRNLIRFRQDFPNPTEILLEQNYRSTQIILDGAKAIIKQNPDRVHKDLFTTREDGEQIIVREAYNDLEEADMVITAIQNLRLDSYLPGDCAIMYRTNAQSRVMEEAFVRAGIPYRLVGATRFYGRREIKDIIAYLRVLHNPADEFSLKRIINVPRRSIGDKTFNQLRDWGLRNGWQPGEALLELAAQPEHSPLSGRALKALLSFAMLYRKWFDLKDQMPLVELLDLILEDINFTGYLNDGTQEGQDRWDNVMEFRNVTLLAAEMPLDQFLEEIALVADADFTDGNEGATLLTLHAAKGLEYPVVFIVGLEDGLLPHSRSIGSSDPEEMAEERRLFYVGITRAQDRLYMSYAFQRMAWGRLETSTPSRFLNDIPEHLVDSRFQSNRSRRQATKARVSEWSWSGGGSGKSRVSRSGSGRSSRSSGSSWQRSKEDDRSRPKKRVTASVPPPKNLPKPRAEEMSEALEPLARKSEPSFHTGDKVHHVKFGSGIVMSSKLTGSDEEVTVAFSDVGVKRLAASIAKLEKL